MKELSIEQKAKRYDEAIKIAKSKIKNDKGHVLYEEDIIEMFPEFKKSEDKRISEDIITYLSTVEDKELIPYESWIAWLEKQTTPKVRTGIEWVNTIDDACDKRYSEEYAYGEYCHEQSFKWGFQEGVEWLENQSKIISANSCKTCEDEQTSLQTNERAWLYLVSDVLTWKDGIGQYLDDPRVQELTKQLCSEYKQKLYNSVQDASFEKKPTDKVEPKFHEGEWVIGCAPEDEPMQIAEITEEGYKTTGGGWIGFSFEEDMHLWSIKDAQDGDLIYVGTEEKGIGAIFKKFDNGIIYFHCYLCADFTQGGYMPMGDVEIIYPWQKMHHQKFFQKMKEAGYEWDSEKKELKKI